MSMHPKNCHLIILVITLLATACKKKASEPSEELPPATQPPALVYDSYLPLKKGNYWIYERFQVERHGPSKSLNQFDSMYVEKDSLIRGALYHKICKYNFVFAYRETFFLKDSLHYILDSAHGKKFSYIDFNTIFYDFYQINLPDSDTVLYASAKMSDPGTVIKTSAGTFTTISLQLRVDLYPAFQKPGNITPFFLNTRYAKNVGIVSETEPPFVTVPYFTERRLIRYKLN